MKRRMRRNWPVVATISALLLITTGVAQAQEEEPEMTMEGDDMSKPAQDKPVEEGEPEEVTEEPQGEGEGGTIELGGDATAGVEEKADLKLGENRVSWQDIVTVVRKPFLKVRRIQLLPMWGVTMNDNIIRHLQLTLALNYFLTDVLAVGLEGQYYVKDLREPYDLVSRQARRLPTVNQYNYGAALNFHYVPIYGKFAILDDTIIHWETFFTAGIGFTQSEVIPRDPALQPFKNFLITPNVGASMRFFVFKWLTVDFGIRDYIFVDKFEAANRGPMDVSGEDAKSNADSSLINNVVFQAGVSFWLPPKFEYTTFR
jgi:outer membrane beta-barrel protein